ncbi:MAG: N-acetyl-gamma-glutamyl-phosphate reductase [Verrucomicrobia bacterium]|nr:N-acetyl-gamma-glutamyl-phosphate reductase [Verrucomicrobiota bacterium]
MIKAKVVGAGGYGGVGITELLLRHPSARLACLVDVADVGLPLSALYPHLAGFCDMTISAPDSAEAQAAADVVFFSTPDGVGMQLAEAELKKGARVIDYSGDFRFNDADTYAEYARRIDRDPVHKSPHLLPQSVYGLAELHRAEIGRDQRLVGNPGCFAVSCLLGLAPAVRHGLVDLESLICDCKTGVSGAGKKPAPSFHYPARYDHMNAYRLAGHQHVMEVERELGLLAGEAVRVTFTAQVVPTCRGILSCLYGTLREGLGPAKVMEAYREFYRGSPFVRLYDRTATIGTVHVRGTNYGNLIVDVDERTNRLRVISHIDNLMKGQAGNALQNMNLLFGRPETEGLDRAGQYP